MTSTSSMQKSAMTQYLTQAKAALRGQGAVEAGPNGRKARTASTGRAKGRFAGVSLIHRRLKKAKIKI